ncbi:MAG: hypothetical protein ABFR36_02145 [Acidobacteriota bacterium]
MEEKLFEIDMIYIKSSDGISYSIECASRRGKSVVLNYPDVEGIEINAAVTLELKNAFMTCSGRGEKIWNMRFNTPANLKISYSGKVLIQVI